MTVPPAANSFEGGTQGTTITAANSGGLSGTAFDSITNAGGATIIYDNAHAQGTLAMKIITSAGSDEVYGKWSSLGAIASPTDLFFRQYIYITAYPAVIVRFSRCLTTTSAQVMTIAIVDTGIIKLEDTVTNALAPGTVPMALNQWVRLEWRVRPLSGGINGQGEWRLYNSADSTTITDTNSISVANSDNNIDQALFGVPETLAPSSYSMWMDNIAISTSGWIGPANPPSIGSVSWLRAL